MYSIVYANCCAALRQQSRRCPADASSTACHECYLFKPRNHNSSISIFVPPAHFRQAAILRSIRSGGRNSQHAAAEWLSRTAQSGPKFRQSRELTWQITGSIWYSLCHACSRFNSVYRDLIAIAERSKLTKCRHSEKERGTADGVSFEVLPTGCYPCINSSQKRLLALSAF